MRAIVHPTSDNVEKVVSLDGDRTWSEKNNRETNDRTISVVEINRIVWKEDPEKKSPHAEKSQGVPDGVGDSCRIAESDESAKRRM